jgi:hypothetical protein
VDLDLERGDGMYHSSTITDEDRKFVETWENVSANQTAIVKLDPRGNETHQLISGSRKFLVTTEERLLTQDRIRLEKDDPFKNGSFRPIHVPATVTIDTNPNALSDEDILQILRGSDVAWEQWMAVLDSVATLQRMLDSAEEANTSLRRYRQLEARIAELKPKRRVVQKERGEFEKIGAK